MLISEIYSNRELARQISQSLHPSLPWLHLHRVAIMVREMPVECWENSRFVVLVRRYLSGCLFHPARGAWATILIAAISGAPEHDWREFQCIKNDVVGADWEAVELYPAEARLIDDGNKFTLWACPHFPIGLNQGRHVTDETNPRAPQRPWSHAPA